MLPEIEITTGQIALGVSPQVLITRGIGSCVAVGLYSRIHQTGALLHILLPHSQDAAANPLRFADTAIPSALAQLAQHGIQAHELVAYLAGGASMFTHLADLTAIGERNVIAVEQQLHQLGIQILHKEVRGNQGRNVHFDLATGEFMITYN